LKQFKVVVIGGGTGGAFTGSRLARAFSPDQVAIIEPLEVHYYQPLWTLVGAGIMSKEETARPMSSIIPKGVNWIKQKCASFQPETNSLTLESGEEIGYEFLVVAPGIKIDWNKTPGVEGNFGKNGICSNYQYDTVDTTWQAMQDFKGGTAVFTMPPPPFKCPGAAQKIMYLAEEWFRMQGVRDKARVIFISAVGGTFGIPKYKASLDKIIEERGIETMFQHNLKSVDADNKILTAENLQTGEMVEIPFDMLHVTPAQCSPDFIKNSPLANQDGWVDVDQYTLQHKKYPNIFSCGDASSSPNAKTGAAIRKQAPILVKNLISVDKGKPLTEKYDGYTSCPVVVSRGKCIMAEFGYDDKVLESFPFDQAVPRWTMYFLKKDILPILYWNLMVKGLM